MKLDLGKFVRGGQICKAGEEDTERPLNQSFMDWEGASQETPETRRKKTVVRNMVGKVWWSQVGRISKVSKLVIYAIYTFFHS